MKNTAKIIDETQKFLYDHLNESDYDNSEIEYRYDHSLRVANIGHELAKLEQANEKIVVLGCLLHDVGKFDTDDNIEHGRVSAKVARKFLETLDLTQKEVDDICYAIAVHVDGKCGYEYEETLESKLVSDSDNIDRFGANRILQRVQWQMKEPETTKEEKIKNTRELLERLNKYYNGNILETESGNAKFRQQLELQIHYYTEYLREIELTKIPVL